MLLVVDVGNTQTHFGAFRGEELLEHWRFATVRQSTADQLGAALSNLLELRGYRFADLDAWHAEADALRALGVVHCIDQTADGFPPFWAVIGLEEVLTVERQK